jgi:hypothetical protein
MEAVKFILKDPKLVCAAGQWVIQEVRSLAGTIAWQEKVKPFYIITVHYCDGTFEHKEEYIGTAIDIEDAPEVNQEKKP